MRQLAIDEAVKICPFYELPARRNKNDRDVFYTCIPTDSYLNSLSW